MSSGKWVLLGMAVVVLVIGLWVLNRTVFVGTSLVEKATDPDKIISNYEEFQTIWNTCQKLDADLKTICDTPDADPMFAQFSKSAMVAQKRQKMTRWVQEYNAKSKMVTRQYWKAAKLPYQLSEEDFPNYNCNNKGDGR